MTNEPGNLALAMIEATPKAARERLLAIRELIFDTAARTQGVGAVEEALRWNEPAYLTSKTGSGSTLRINARGTDGDVVVYFNCNTDLVDTFRRLYPDSFTFEGNRALVLPAGAPIPEPELAHCVSLALTYHARNKPKRGRPKKVGS
jgi:hypothetical protein